MVGSGRPQIGPPSLTDSLGIPEPWRPRRLSQWAGSRPGALEHFYHGISCGFDHGIHMAMPQKPGTIGTLK